MTAVTLAGTLSRVMISWGGTSMVTVLRSILTILSTIGRRMKSPGPLGPPCTLPILKITPRSYSLTILMALNMTATTNIATTTTTITVIPTPTACNKPKVAYIGNPPLSCSVEFPATTGQFDGHYLHYLSLTETHHSHLAPYPYHELTFLRIVLLWGECKHRPPQLAVHEHPPRRVRPHEAPYGSYLADHSFLAGENPAPSEGAQRTQDSEEHTTHDHRNYHQSTEQHPRVRDARPKERQASGK